VGFVEGAFQLLNAATGREIATFPAKANGMGARYMEPSPDGGTLAIVRRSYTGMLDPNQAIEVWDIAKHRQTQILQVRPQWISQMTFSPDSRMFALAYSRGIVESWDLTTHRKLNLHDPTCIGIRGMAFSKDGRTLAAAGWGAHVSLWEVETGKAFPKIGGAFIGFAGMAFSGDDRRLAVGVEDGSVRLWDMTGEKPQEVANLKGVDAWPSPVSFLPDGNTVVACLGNELFVWRAPTFAEIDADEKIRGQSP
jgi:WD40 repeat protein